MATKSFALRTEPHVAEIGDDLRLELQPEVMGDEFMDSYQALLAAQRGLDLDNVETLDPSDIRRVGRAVRVFLAGVMLPESAALITRVDVVDANGSVLGSFQDDEEAQGFAAGHASEGARIVDGLRLPHRVLVDLVEWVVELYSGGQRPPTSSSGSSTASRPPGTRGTGSSPSKASTRARGR